MIIHPLPSSVFIMEAQLIASKKNAENQQLEPQKWCFLRGTPPHFQLKHMLVFGGFPIRFHNKLDTKGVNPKATKTLWQIAIIIKSYPFLNGHFK